MREYPSILVVDDHQIVSSGIELILHAKKMHFAMHSCQRGNDALDFLNDNQVDIVIMDINLPDTDTEQLVKLILTLYPKQRILMYTMSSSELYANRFLQLGVGGFLSKQATNDEFIVALKTVLNGENYNPQYQDNTVFTESSISRKKKSLKKIDGEFLFTEKIESTFFVKVGNAYKSIELDEVTYFEVDGKYVLVNCHDRKYSIRSSLTNIENRLKKGFIRVHSKILVNQKHIKLFKPNESKIYLESGGTVPFSRHFKKNLFENIVVT